jgi:hypothetical protein
MFPGGKLPFPAGGMIHKALLQLLIFIFAGDGS